MNPAWLLENWKLIAAVLLVSALGIQTYRLQGAQGEVKLLTNEKVERERRDAMRVMQNERNKERTDEEYADAQRRAATARVQPQPPARIDPGPKVELAGSGDESTVCLSRELLNRELAGFAQRSANRLAQVIASVSTGDAERLSSIAQQSEGVAAAYRSCRAFALNLAELQRESTAELLATLRSIRERTSERCGAANSAQRCERGGIER